jgi:branched-chain amino acid transport system ATP-binding protein
VRFGGVLAVNNVSFDVRPGEVFTLIGPNGAGKTTVFNLISRIYTPTTGEIDYSGPAGASQAHRPAAARVAGAGHCAHLPEHRAVRARHGAAQPADRAPHPPQDRFLERTVLHARHARAELEAREKASRSSTSSTCSTTATRWWPACPMACARWWSWPARCAPSRKLLLLDEPSSGLNVEETDDMAFWIQDIKNELGITVLMVEHDMTLVSKVSDRVLAMNQGEVLAMGTPREVQNDPGVIEAYLGSIDDVSSLRRPA